MRKLLLFFVGFSGFLVMVNAQSLPTSKDPGTDKREAYQPAKKTRKHTYNLNAEFDRLKKEYAIRMKKNVRKYKRMSRKMKKPQYSDPLYFGHKRKPKKRKVGKRKLCKECMIVH
jgi:hypothetical protein